jgi:F-box and WD-40 domain protein 1/11
VWDAHYPWSCQKIIGPPAARTFRRGPINSPSSQATGSSPFMTITPPWPTADQTNDIMAPLEEESIYHSASILCLQFDEEIMVTGSSDFTCIVYDIKDDYRPIRRLEGHHAGVLDVCFDDRYIVSCSKDTTICVWDRSTGELLRQLNGHEGPVNAVQLRGDLIVSASGDGVAKMWNVITGQCVKEFASKDRGLACVEFSDDGRTILTGGNDRIIYQFDANTGELVNELHGHSGLIRSLHLDSANKRIVSGSYDMSVKVFDRDTGNLSINFPGWTTSWMLSVQSDYRRIVATSQDSRAVIIDFGYGLDGIDLLEE